MQQLTIMRDTNLFQLWKSKALVSFKTHSAHHVRKSPNNWEAITGQIKQNS